AVAAGRRLPIPRPGRKRGRWSPSFATRICGRPFNPLGKRSSAASARARDGEFSPPPPFRLLRRADCFVYTQATIYSRQTMKTHKVARISGALGGLFGILVAGAIMGAVPAAAMGDKPQEQASPAKPAEQKVAAADGAAKPATRDRFDGTADIVLGDENAPITVIEYASLTCSHCAAFHANVFPEFKKQYVETGKAKFILRHFVLNGPDLAASMVARCGT